MKEFHQRHGLSIQNISFSAPSKTAKLASAALFISPFSPSLSPSDLFPSKRPLKKKLTFKGDLVVVFLFCYVPSLFCSLRAAISSSFCCLNCTDLGQRLISLSLLTNPSLRACILLAFRPLRFNNASADMTSHYRQRLGDMSLVPCNKEMVVFPARSINHT